MLIRYNKNCRVEKNKLSAKPNINNNNKNYKRMIRIRYAKVKRSITFI